MFESSAVALLGQSAMALSFSSHAPYDKSSYDASAEVHNAHAGW